MADIDPAAEDVAREIGGRAFLAAVSVEADVVRIVAAAAAICCRRRQTNGFSSCPIPRWPNTSVGRLPTTIAGFAGCAGFSSVWTAPDRRFRNRVSDLGHPAAGLTVGR